MITLAERTPLHLPELHLFDENGITHALDSEAPNWVAVDARGATLLQTMRERDTTFGGLVARYAADHALEAGKAWVHVHDFLSALNRASLLFDAPVRRDAYEGRA